MKVYTKHGDKGMSSLASSGMQLFKSDERFDALGTIDELTSQIGLAKVLVREEALRLGLTRVQRDLMTLMAGVADARNAKYVITDEEIAFLESEMDRMDEALPEEFHFILPGGSEVSARLDVARTVARRAERALVTMDRRFSTQGNYKAFINRVSDYLYIMARYLDQNAGAAATFAEPARSAAPVQTAAAVNTSAAANIVSAGGDRPMEQNDVVKEVLRQLGDYRALDLARAKRLIDAVEQYAQQQGKKAVIAVCNSEGNPIAVHVMDGAFLVSYEVAVKKAYTSVAVKMSTMELSKIAQPGGTFYGLANLDKMVIFGGGVPLMENGKIVGGLGVSGGTGEEDHALCEYALSVFPNL